MSNKQNNNTSSKETDRSKDVKDDTYRRNHNFRRGKGSNRNNNRSGSHATVPSRDEAYADRYNTSSDTENSVNDLSWYARDENLLQAAAMLGFPYKPGMSVSLGVSHPNGHNNSASRHLVRKTIPGILQIGFEFTVGSPSSTVTSPASIAAGQLWEYVRRNFSGSLGFDAPDLFMFLMAVDQMHAFISYCKRVYRSLSVYSPQNLYLPHRVTEAVVGVCPEVVNPAWDTGLDYDALVANKVEFRVYINELVNMANKFIVPDAYDIFHRHRWMCEHVYSDDNTLMGQMYVFTPRGFFRISEEDPKGTSLVYESLAESGIYGYESASKPLKWNPALGLYEYGKKLINSLSQWEDAYDMNGRLMKVFEGQTPFVSAEITPEERIQIDWVPEVLTQIHNLTQFAGFMNANITQDPANNNAIIYQPTLGFARHSGNTIIDIPSSNPSPAEVTLATRLTAAFQYEQFYADGPRVPVFTCGTEVVTTLALTWMGHAPTTLQTSLYNDWVNFDQQTVVKWTEYWHDFGTQPLADRNAFDRLYQALVIQSELSNYMMAPYFWIQMADAQLDGEVSLINDETIIGGNVVNASTLTFDFLEQLHKVCLYSEFNCFPKTKI